MTDDTGNARVDEVAHHYVAPRRVACALRGLFFAGTGISLVMLYLSSLHRALQHLLTIGFLLCVLVHFVLSQAQRHYWLPRAEQQRRRTLLSDAFGVRLSHERTELYYNNAYAPSVRRLGANVLENSFFSREISSRMLSRTRLEAAIYAVVWVITFASRDNDMGFLVFVTQVVFSAEILSHWLNIEVLHRRFEYCFELLHGHFRAGMHADAADGVADVLNATISYEAAKSSAGVLLDDKLFSQLNPSLSVTWERIRQDLGLGDSEPTQ